MGDFVVVSDDEMPKFLEAVEDGRCVSCYGPRDGDSLYCGTCDDAGEDQATTDHIWAETL